MGVNYFKKRGTCFFDLRDKQVRHLVRIDPIFFSAKLFTLTKITQLSQTVMALKYLCGQRLPALMFFRLLLVPQASHHHLR